MVIHKLCKYFNNRIKNEMITVPSVTSYNKWTTDDVIEVPFAIAHQALCSQWAYNPATTKTKPEKHTHNLKAETIFIYFQTFIEKVSI